MTDLPSSVSWCLPCGIGAMASVIPYFYCLYFAALLVHRERRDDLACRNKYGRCDHLGGSVDSTPHCCHSSFSPQLTRALTWRRSVSSPNEWHFNPGAVTHMFQPRRCIHALTLLTHRQALNGHTTLLRPHILLLTHTAMTPFLQGLGQVLLDGPLAHHPVRVLMISHLCNKSDTSVPPAMSWP